MVKDLQEYRHWCWNCFRDSTCKHIFTWHLKDPDYDEICPAMALHKFDAYTGQGKMEIGRAFIENEIEWSEKVLEILYKDLLCGGCSYNCGRVMEMNPTDVILALRVKAIRDGLNPPGGFKVFLENQRKFMNPYKKLDAERGNWIKGLPADVAENISGSGAKTKALLFVGCVTMRDAEGEKVAQNAVTLLAKAGIDVGVLAEKEKCCGNPSLRMGDKEAFTSFAKDNIKMFNEMGIQQVITTCPFCYSTFRRDYPDVGEKMNFEVVHIIDLVDRLIQQGKLKLTKPVNMNITWHDPCHLGRLSGYGISGANDFQGLYKEPRNIIKSIPGVKLTEMFRTKDDNFCCGGGSWMREGYPDFAQWTALQRLEEAKATGVEGLVTYCSHCEENFGEALRSQGSKMKLYNLLELVLQAL